MPSTGAINPVKGQRKTKTGRVVSDRMDKTIVVSVERLTRHRLYKRVVRASTKFAAHDEANEARIGDTVLIEESRPLSATKRWRLVSVLSSSGAIPAGDELVAEEAETTEAIHHATRSAAEDSVADKPAADAQAEEAQADADASGADAQAEEAQAGAEESGADSEEAQA
jgi:small subunit ribosomal protein S17